jgi:hypothetical protein
MDPKGAVPEANVARAANYPPLQSNWPTTSWSMDPEVPSSDCSPRVSMKTPTTAGLLLLAVLLTGCPIDGYAENPTLAIAQACQAKTTKRVKPVKAAETHRAPLGVKLLSEPLRNIVFQDRLRGLCELVKAERVSAGKWRASCTDGGAFIIKVYRDGFMTVTRC